MKATTRRRKMTAETRRQLARYRKWNGRVREAKGALRAVHERLDAINWQLGEWVALARTMRWDRPAFGQRMDHWQIAQLAGLVRDHDELQAKIPFLETLLRLSEGRLRAAGSRRRTKTDGR